MKKTPKRMRLQLRSERIRVVALEELRNAAGAVYTVGCQVDPSAGNTGHPLSCHHCEE